VNKKVRFLVTSDDVIHSWWVPKLGVKRDAIPGFVHEAWARIDKPGTYRGQCAELCGIYHGYMPIVVKAVSQEKFNQWVEKQEKVAHEKTAHPDVEPKALMALGEKVYNTNCAACHKPDGTGMPPLFPGLKGSSVSVGHPISRHVSLVLKGVPGSAMQAFEGQLSDKELAAVVTYERNAWGNNTGDVVQPSFVAGVKDGKIEDPIAKKANKTEAK
jgi:cytochrome c oxidase subunit 2